MNQQLVTGYADQPGNSCFFEHGAQLPGTIACSPAFEVISVVDANVIMHSSRCDYGFISCAKVKYLSDKKRRNFDDIYCENERQILIGG